MARSEAGRARLRRGEMGRDVRGAGRRTRTRWTDAVSGWTLQRRSTKRDGTLGLQQADPRAESIESAVYYPWFDWLRLVCASIVVLQHNDAFPWPRAGSFAVVVFFALSGWLIGGILLDREP